MMNYSQDRPFYVRMNALFQDIPFIDNKVVETSQNSMGNSQNIDIRTSQEQRGHHYPPKKGHQTEFNPLRIPSPVKGGEENGREKYY